MKQLAESQSWLRPSTIAAALLAFAIGVVLLLSTGQDDPYITYWAAHSLAESGEILNHSGARVEQSSSLLDTLILAFATAVSGVPLPALGYWAAVLAGGLASLRALALCGPLGLKPSPLIVVVIGTMPAFLYWWFSGMETTLQAWVMVELAIAGSRLLSNDAQPAHRRIAIVTAAWMTVRPEAAFVLLAALMGWIAWSLLFARNQPGEADARRRLIQWLVVAIALFGALTLFRWLYFGSPFPQPVLAKAGGNLWDTLGNGLSYAVKVVTQPLAPSVGAVVLLLPLLVWRERGAGEGPRTARLILALIGAQMAFLITAGGDWMTGGRFVAPLAPLCVVAGARAVCQATTLRRYLRPIAFATLAVQAVGILALSMGGTGQPLWRFLQQDPGTLATGHWSERANRIHLRDLAFVEPMNRIVGALKHSQPDKPVTILSRQAGMVMYYVALAHTGHIEFIDLYGLSSRHVAKLGDRLPVQSRSVWPRVGFNAYLSTPDALRPDLIFDVHNTAQEVMRHGFEVVDAQVGRAPGWGFYLGPLRVRRDYTLFQYLTASQEVAARIPEGLRSRVNREVSPKP